MRSLLLGLRDRVAAANALAQGNATDVVEFYHLGLDHYFIRPPAEMPRWTPHASGWARTGRSFRAYDAAHGTSPSRSTSRGLRRLTFYSASPASARGAREVPALVYESGVMYVGLPTRSLALVHGLEPSSAVDASARPYRYTIDLAVSAP